MSGQNSQRGHKYDSEGEFLIQHGGHVNGETVRAIPAGILLRARTRMYRNGLRERMERRDGDSGGFLRPVMAVPWERCECRGRHLRLQRWRLSAAEARPPHSANHNPLLLAICALSTVNSTSPLPSILCPSGSGFFRKKLLSLIPLWLDSTSHSGWLVFTWYL